MKFSFTKNLESEFFYTESKSKKNESNKKNLAGGRGGCGGVAMVNDFLFPKESETKKCCLLFFF